MPETVYVRKPIKPIQDAEKASDDHKSAGSERDVEQISSVPAPMSYWRSLRVFTGTYATDESAFRVVWKPFALLASPTVLVSEQSLSEIL